MKTISQKALLMFCDQIAALVNSHGMAILRHVESDVEHHVVPGAKGWLVTTQSGLGVLHQVEYTSIESLGLDLVGTQLVAPQTRLRRAAG